MRGISEAGEVQADDRLSVDQLLCEIDVLRRQKTSLEDNVRDAEAAIRTVSK